jgi:hypothetical protein
VEYILHGEDIKNIYLEEKEMTFRLDSGKFPHMNYNRVVQKSRMHATRNRPDVPMSLREARQMWKISQDVNSVNEPQIAIKGKPQGRTRQGLI